MSRMLLDTDAFMGLRRVRDSRPLPEALILDLETADEVALSAASLFEYNQKIRVGKLDAREVDDREIATLEEAGIALLALTPAIMSRAALLQWTHKGRDHRDPFDRMIASTALSGRFTVVSSDRAFGAIDIGHIAF